MPGRAHWVLQHRSANIHEPGSRLVGLVVALSLLTRFLATALIRIHVGLALLTLASSTLLALLPGSLRALVTLLGMGGTLSTLLRGLLAALLWLFLLAALLWLFLLAALLLLTLLAALLLLFLLAALLLLFLLTSLRIALGLRRLLALLALLTLGSFVLSGRHV